MVCGKERGLRRRLEIEPSIQGVTCNKMKIVPTLPELADFLGSKAASAEAFKQNLLSTVLKKLFYSFFYSVT